LIWAIEVMSTPSRGARAASLALVGYVVIAALATLPLLTRLASAVAGDRLDAVQTVWGFWWFGLRGVAQGWPWYSSLLWWPQGSPLWFQTWDLPSAAVYHLVAGNMPPAEAYNVAVFASFPLAGLAFFLLAKELYGDALAAFLAGCLYTFSPFHFAASMANLHIASLEWSPIYFLGLMRVLRRNYFSDAVYMGVGLGLATLASLYHLVFCALATAIILGARLVEWDVSWLSRRLIALGAVAGAIFTAITGWLLGHMIAAYASEHYLGAHDAARFSIDLQSLVLVNRISAWSGMSRHWLHWTGAEWSAVGYLGYVLIALACYASWRRLVSRQWLAMMIIGVLLALGPTLHIGGRVFGDVPMPYGLLTSAVPLVGFGGIPSRFIWLASFGGAVAAGATLAVLCQGSRWLRVLAVALTVAAVVEVWPHRFTMTTVAAPQILRDWAKMPSDFAVLDASGPSTALWHQTIHHHPIVGGFVTRVPERLMLKLTGDQVVSSFFPPPVGPTRADLPFARDVAIKHLMDLRIRFVITPASYSQFPDSLHLPVIYRDDAVTIYDVGGATS
jgi:hypothetical protein